MRAAVTVAPRQIDIREVAEPTPAPGEALVEIEAVGICGSDLHLFLGDHPYAHFPLIQGHEIAATVLTLPDDAPAALAVGDRVAVEPYFSCGRCFPCRHGHWNSCVELTVLGAQTDGALTERLAVPVDKLHPAGELDAEVTALVEPISIGAMAVERAGVATDDRVAVYGAGPIGQAILLACKARSASVLVVDLIESRLELATALGADEVSEARDARRALDRFTDGDGPGAVFEASGVPAVLQECCAVVAPSGRVCVVGLSTKDVSLPMVDFTRKELTVIGARAGLFRPATALIRADPERSRRLISHRFEFGEAHQAMTFALEHPQDADKVMIVR